jgi:hypothetical protein
MSILTKIKGAFKSKTIHFNVILLITVSVLVFVFPEYTKYLNQVSMGLGAIVNIYLRSITAQSLYEKGNKNENT